MKIPITDLKAQYLDIKKEIDTAIEKVILGSAFINGEELKKFETSFAEFCGVRYGVGVASGSAALDLVLLALNLRPGDEVILPSHTFIATAEAVLHAGAKPVFVDIDPRTYNIDPKEIERAITKRTKVIIPVHIYGQPAEMDSILSVAKRHNLIVVEDAAQAHGAVYKDRKVGSFGKVAIFSFFPSKVLGCYGDSGMVVTDDKELAEKISLLRDHGRKQKYDHEIIGFGLRMDNLQAAILKVKFKYLNKWIEKRRKVAKLYSKLLSDSKVVIPYEPDYVKSVYYVYSVLLEKRDKVQKELFSRGIMTGIYYPIPLHLQPALKFLGFKRGSFPITEKVAGGILSLPMYPELTEEKIRKITKYLLRLI